MKKNNKGFTLIELLAVIVILAVLILVALPAVTNLMTRSRKAAFRTEALSMAREGVRLAYEANLVSGNSAVPPSSGTVTPNGIVYKVSGGEYLCMTFSDLVNKGYIEKSNITGYNGHVSIFVDTAGKSEMYINLTNGTYYIVDNFNVIANGNDVDTLVSTSTTPSEGVSGADSNSYSAACPTISNTNSSNTKAALLK